MAKLPPLTLQDVEIGFRNFSGAKGKFNEAGERSFVLFLDEATAAAMEADGWNIKWTKPREGYEDEFVLKGKLHVAITYPPKARQAPKIFMITHKGKNEMPEELVGMLDFVRIKTVDLTLNPYSWTVRENSGIKAYLSSVYITIEEDLLELKYAHLDEVEAIEDGTYIDGEVLDEYVHQQPAIGG